MKLNKRAGDYIVGALLTIEYGSKTPCSQKTWEKYLKTISNFTVPKNVSNKTLCEIANYFNSILCIGLQDEKNNKYGN